MPEPAPGEVLVRLEFAAVNHLDIWVRIGNVPVKLPIIPGSEGAGVVEATGQGEEAFSPGQEVVVTPGSIQRGTNNCP